MNELLKNAKLALLGAAAVFAVYLLLKPTAQQPKQIASPLLPSSGAYWGTLV